MADGEVRIKFNAETDEANKKIEKLKEDIELLERSVEEMETRKNPLVKQAEEARIQIKKLKNDIAEIRKAEGEGSPKEFMAQFELSKAEQEYTQIIGQIDKVDKKLLPAYTKLDRMKQEAGEISANIEKANSATGKMAANAGKAKEKFDKMSKRISGLVKRVLFYSIILKALRALRDWFVEIVRVDERASQAIARLKGALLTLAQPIVDSLIPAFVSLVNIASDFAWIMARLLAPIFGTTSENASESAESLYEQQQALEGVSGAAKDASKSLASFDEIQQIGQGSKTSTIAPDFSGADLAALPESLRKIIETLEIKIQNLVFDFQEGNIMQNIDNWNAAFGAMLGMVLGGMFGGFSGGIITGLLGMVIGFSLPTFIRNKGSDISQEESNASFTGILGAILGAVIGGRVFKSLTGSVIGLTLGMSIGLLAPTFADNSEGGNIDKVKSSLLAVLGATTGLLLGFAFKFKGSSLVMSATVGMALALGLTEFTAGEFSAEQALATFGTTTAAMLAYTLGSMFKGTPAGIAAGAVVVALGLTIHFVSVLFDDATTDSEKTAAARNLSVIIGTLLGAIVGLAFGGPVGALIGGVLGLALGVIFGLTLEDIQTTGNFEGEVEKSIADYFDGSSLEAPAPSVKIPAPNIATGGVIPNSTLQVGAGAGTSYGVDTDGLPAYRLPDYGALGMGRYTADSAYSQALYGKGVTMEVDGVTFAQIIHQYGVSERNRMGVDLAEG